MLPRSRKVPFFAQKALAYQCVRLHDYFGFIGCPFLMTVGRQIERVLVVATGGVAIYLGFRLFYLVKQRQGELLMQGKEFKLSIGDVAPGVYFALFGSMILVVDLFSKVEEYTGSQAQIGTLTNGPIDAATIYMSRGLVGGGAPGGQPQDSALPFAFRNYRDPAMEKGANLLLARVTSLRQSVQNGTAASLWKPEAVNELRSEIRPYVLSPHYLRVLEECKSVEDVWIFLESYFSYFYLTQTKPQ